MFGEDAQILGKTIRLNSTEFTIVGVAPENFKGAAPLAEPTSVWIPTAMFRVGYRYCDVAERDCRIVTLIGRLAKGRSAVDAQAAFTVLARQLETAFPTTNRGIGAAVYPARGVPGEKEEAVRTSTLLLTVAGLVLLIACANIAGLLLARGTARRHEIAVRCALGATRARVIRQLLTESILLGVIGGGLGLLVSKWAQKIVEAMFASAFTENTAANFSLPMDSKVLLVTLGISVLAGIVFGLAPAGQSSRADLIETLRGSVSNTSRSGYLRDALVLGQVALSLVLIAGAGLLARSLANVYDGQNYDPSHLLWVRLRPSLVGYSAEKAWAYQREVIRRLESLPGVIAASPEDYMPLHQNSDDARVWLPSAAPSDMKTSERAGLNQVGANYFGTLGLKLISGRDFDERDQKNSADVAIVNETLSRRYWRGSNPVGQSLAVDGKNYLVVGVAKDAQFLSAGSTPIPFVYVNYWQQDTSKSTWGEDSRTLIRVAGDPEAMLPAIRREIVAVDAEVPISEDQTFSSWIAWQYGPVRTATAFVSCFAILALFLSAIGLYGILAFSVSQRIREFGIRMALGASAANIAATVIRRGAALAIGGSAVGICVALLSARFLSSFLYGVQPISAGIFVLAPAIFLVVAMAASYFPARRAMRVDPISALRHE